MLFMKKASSIKKCLHSKKRRGICSPHPRWFTAEGGKLRVGGGFEKTVKNWLIFERILVNWS
jgi:hypothetical protein